MTYTGKSAAARNVDPDESILIAVFSNASIASTVDGLCCEVQSLCTPF
jgi:hypothetical protein